MEHIHRLILTIFLNTAPTLSPEPHCLSSHIIACDWDTVVLPFLAPSADAPPLPVCHPDQDHVTPKMFFECLRCSWHWNQCKGRQRGTQCVLHVKVNSSVTFGKVSGIRPWTDKGGGAGAAVCLSAGCQAATSAVWSA